MHASRKNSPDAEVEILNDAELAGCNSSDKGVTATPATSTCWFTSSGWGPLFETVTVTDCSSSKGGESSS